MRTVNTDYNDIAYYTYETDSVQYQVTEYLGNIMNIRTKEDTIITDQQKIFNSTGYYTDGKYFHYVKNHLGSICMVIESETDSIVQSTSYLASGVPSSDNLDEQPYLYNGKEFLSAHGLNTYDYGFRRYYAPIGRFTSIDPLAEQTPWQSPYSYANNNFINNVDWMGLGGLTRLAQYIDIYQYIVIDMDGNYLGGVDNDDESIYLDEDGEWNPENGEEGLKRVGKMMFPFWVYENWIGKGNKAPGLFYGNNYSISVSASIGFQVSVFDFIFNGALPSWELFNYSNSFWNYSDGFNWGYPDLDYIGNNNEYKTTLKVQCGLGYEYSIKHNVISDLPVTGSQINTFSFFYFFGSSNGTLGLTISLALIGGISISITGNFYYDGN